jgi:hypothetical protein
MRMPHTPRCFLFFLFIQSGINFLRILHHNMSEHSLVVHVRLADRRCQQVVSACLHARSSSHGPLQPVVRAVHGAGAAAAAGALQNSTAATHNRIIVVLWTQMKQGSFEFLRDLRQQM